MGLAALEDLEVVYLQAVYGREEDQHWLPVEVGFRQPAYCTAAGQVLLAALDEDERRERVERMRFEDPEVPTGWTAELLWSALEDTEREGVGINDAGSELGVQEIAVGVSDDEGRLVAAVGLTGFKPQVSIKRLLVDHLEALEQTAEEISWVGSGLVGEKLEHSFAKH